MPIVQLPDGTLVTLPEPGEKTPAQKQISGAAETAGNIGGFLVKSAKDVGRGFLSGLASLGEGAAAVSSGGMGKKDTPKATDPQADIRKILPVDPNQTPAEELWSKGMEGLGGGFSMPIGGGVGSLALTGATSGIGGELGKRFGEKAGGPWGTVGQFLGSGLAGGLTGFLTGPKQSVGKADIRRALADEPPSTFRDAAGNIADFSSTGAKTATLAEAFPANSGIMAVAENARGGNASNALRTRTEGRKEDLQDLGETFLDRIGPEVDPNIVANRAGGAANAVIANTKDLRNEGIRNRLGATPPILPQYVKDVQNQLEAIAATQQRPGAAAAYRRVAGALQGPHGAITNPQELSLAIVELQTAAKNPNSPIYQSGGVSKVDLDRAINAAREGLGQYSPGFQGALDDFAAYSQQVLEPQRVGPIGSLADRNPLQAGQTPISRLGGMVSGNNAKTVERTAQTLSDPMTAGTAKVDPKEIARALAQQKLTGAPTDPGRAIRGNAGSASEDQFSALLKAGGNNVNNTLKPLEVADRLQGMQGAAGINEGPRMMGAQALIRPFRTLDMMATGASQRSVQKEIAELLANPTPEALANLQKIAMFDPGVRARLSMMGLLIPSTQKQGEK